ncbi:MAG: ATP-binding protein [Prochloron sp. SP5CPC1]|nr:ATP-binding protein [Candidatus Paraprochloron terpiosi SP5CPC1]
MDIKLKNLGILRQAEFTLGDLTIICGGNNTGKTYATYALCGFLYLWQQEMPPFEISDDKIEQLLSEGVVTLDLNTYVEQAAQVLAQACQAYSQQLPKIFAAPPERFKETVFEVIINTQDISLNPKFEHRISTAEEELFFISKSEDSTELVITLLRENVKASVNLNFLAENLKIFIAGYLQRIILKPLFPNPFIASAERTGAAIFRKELNFARNRLLEEISQTDLDMDPRILLFKNYQNYALPVEKNVEFTRNLETISKQRSFIAEHHPHILTNFADLIGGEYTVTKDDALYYVPNKGKRVKLSMDESSSAVRSLLDIGFYLKHEAKLGDLLIVDEPELNLHPENQRRVARLFAQLVNLGIKVFITTHSDYIIKELNTLIMLNHDKPYLKRIAEEEGYKSEELIEPEKIKVYIAQKASIKIDGNSRKTQCNTLVAANIDSEFGIDAPSFDITIDTMNRIQEKIVWEDE